MSSPGMSHQVTNPNVVQGDVRQGPWNAIEIDATTPAGLDDAKVITVSEKAATLKFEQSGFEEK